MAPKLDQRVKSILNSQWTVTLSSAQITNNGVVDLDAIGFEISLEPLILQVFSKAQIMNVTNILRFIALVVVIPSYVNSFAVRAGHCRYSPLKAIASPFKGGKRGNKKRHDVKPNVLRIESVEDYKQDVIDEDGKITVVRFYSRYCKSCQASEPFFYKLARDFQEYGVKFVEVPLTPQTNVLHDALEVPSLPWTHIYHPDAGLVEERKVSKKFIDEVRNCLRCYVYGECDLNDAPASCMNVYNECAVDDD